MYPLPRPHAPHNPSQGPKYTFSVPGAPQKYFGRYIQGPFYGADFLLYKPDN